MKRKCLLLVIIALTQICACTHLSKNANTSNLAVMLFVKNKAVGDNLFKKYLESLDIPRYGTTQFGNNDYHVTLAYINGIEAADIKPLKILIRDQIKTTWVKPKIKIGAASYLGCGKPWLVVLAKNAQKFQLLNHKIALVLSEFRHGKYVLDNISLPNQYLSHMTLNGQIDESIKATDASKKLMKVNKRLIGKTIKLPKLVIR